ncbi:MAG: rod shape-determining protein MreC [Actinomycetes bacterium]
MNRDTRRTRLVLALLLVASLTLLTLDFRSGDESPLHTLRRVTNSIVGPVEEGAAAVVRPVADTLSAVGRLGSSDERIDALEKENAELRRTLRTSKLARNRADELDSLLKVAGAGRYKVVPAQVVALGNGQGFAWTATLDVGRSDGIAKDMTVLNGDGLVGRVVSVGAASSTVLLAVDATSAVGARLEGSLEIGVANGAGRDPMELQLLDPQARVGRGDRLVTFGSRGDAPYVPGVPVGMVQRLEPPGELTRTAEVRPFVDFTALDLVGVVVQPPRTDPRDAVLPPRPEQPTEEPAEQPTPQPTPQTGQSSTGVSTGVTPGEQR